MLILILKPESLLAQNIRNNSFDEKVRSDNTDSSSDKDSVNRKTISTPATALHHSPVEGKGSGGGGPSSQIETRSIRMRLNRIFQQEAQLRQKLSGENQDTKEGGVRMQARESGVYPKNKQDEISSATNVIHFEGASVRGEFGYSQRLLEQLLIEKQLLQGRLDALTKAGPGSSKRPSAETSVGRVASFEVKKSSSSSQNPEKSVDDAATPSGQNGPLQSSTYSPSAAIDDAMRKQVNMKQFQSSVDNLLSSRELLIEQYFSDRDLDSLLSALEKQDEYMEAVLAALSPSRLPGEVPLKGGQVNIIV